nr:MAG TPA: hypothetical protein [Caudoviricetes sp.]
MPLLQECSRGFSVEKRMVNYPSLKWNGLVTALWYNELLLPHLVV